MIDITQEFINPYRCSETRFTEVFKIILVGRNAVVHLQATGYLSTYLLHHFSIGHRAVGTEREDNAHIFIGHTQAIHFIDQNRHKNIAVGHTRGVIANKCYGISGFDNFRQSGRSDRIFNGLQHLMFDILHRRKVFGANYF